MPTTIKFPDYQYTFGDPKPSLKDFIQAVEGFLAELVHGGGDDFVDGLDRQAMINAWAEVFPKTFEKIVNAIDDEPITAFIEHGLSGYQLEFKLKAVNLLHNKFQQVRDNFLKPLIEAIDVLLDSILECVKVGGAVKEMKKCIGAVVKAAA